MTNYYVRNMDCGEVEEAGYTDNRLLYEFTLANVRTSEGIITKDSSPIYSVCVEDEAPPKTPRNRTTDIHLNIANQHEITYPSLWFRHNNDYGAYTTYLDVWENYGWTNPNTNLSTFTSELCNFFENAKVTDSSLYGEDKGEINLYIVTVIKKSATIYMPYFMKGNDSNYDSLIVI